MSHAPQFNPSRERLFRLPEIIAPRGPIPVSKSTWWAGVKSGRFPKPVKLGTRIAAWRESDIDAIVEGRNVRPAQAAA